MEQLYKPYNLETAAKSIENILNLESINPECKVSIPSDKELKSLSITQAYATIVCVLFDIELNDDIKSKFKMIRLVASEFYNVLVSHPNIRSVQFLDNKFLCIYDTPLKSDIDEIVEMVAKINALSGYFREKLPNKEAKSSISLSISINYAPVFYCGMGSLDEDNLKVMYQGRQIQETIKMAESLAKQNTQNVIITPVVKSNLKQDYQDFFKETYENTDNYISNVVNTAINDWIKTK